MMKAFSLDSRSHQSSNLLSPGLSEYQGPALLAFNNAKFAAKDFESLASLGASRKEQDAFATGRFGRGFSSVGLIPAASQAYANEGRSSIGLIARLLCLAERCSSLILIIHGPPRGTLLEGQNGISRPLRTMTQ